MQPVVRADGSTVDGMLLYYGWKNENDPEATAFLLHEANSFTNENDKISELPKENVLLKSLLDADTGVGPLAAS